MQRGHLRQSFARDQPDGLLKGIRDANQPDIDSLIANDERSDALAIGWKRVVPRAIR